MAELSVILKGKIDDLERDLKKANKLLKETGEAAETSGKKLDDSSKKGAKSVGFIESSAKSLTSSFIGPAGVVAAVGAVLVAIDLLNQRGNKISQALEFISGGVDAVMEAQRELNAETQKGIGVAQGQIAVLDELIDLARDETVETKKRQEAVDRLNKKYKEQLGFLDLEKVKTESVEKARLKLGEALIREAKIRGAQSLIAKETEKILEEEQKSAIDAANGWDILAAAIKNGQNVFGGAGVANDIITAGLIRQRKEITKSEDKIKALTERLRVLLGEDLSFDRVAAPKITPEKVETTPFFTDEELAKRFGLDPNAQKKLESKASETSQKITKAIARDLDATPVAAYTARIEEILIDFNDSANEIIQNGIVNTFAGIGEAIGSALSESQNIGDALGKALLGSIGAMLIQLGELAISTGIGILAINTALKSLNPYVAIAAGVALVALGALVSSSAAKIGSGGGQSTGSGSVSGQGSSSVNSFSGGSSSNLSTSTGGEFVFRIRGRELIGVIENELAASRRLGGIGTIGG